jgi:hypothetical protein
VPDVVEVAEGILAKRDLLIYLYLAAACGILIGIWLGRGDGRHKAKVEIEKALERL